MSTPAQRVIEGAYKILSDEKRWTKGCFRRGEAMCLLEAINQASFAVADDIGDGYRVANALARQPGTTTAGFNDYISTTHADILALLRRAHKAAGDGSPEVFL